MTRDLLDSIQCPHTTLLDSALDMVHLDFGDVGDSGGAIAHGAANLWHGRGSPRAPHAFFRLH